MAVRIDPERNEAAALRRIGARFDGLSILEVGCGDGRLTNTFAERARSVIAIDPDPGTPAEFFQTTWPPHVEFRPVGIDAFGLATNRFDVVLFSWSL
jgi:2-polyprenyl-3-methyl-5-hydroxy-6-metoxy-1,4-benzoquinol methylase